MRDIVDRLRGAADGTCGLDEAEAMALCNDADDEIERFREAKIDAAWAFVEGYDQGCHDSREDLS